MPNFLGEYLQEQQEPFSLKVYLLERGYQKGTNLNARSSFLNSAKFLKSSAARCGLKKRRHAIPNCSNFVKAVFRQLVSVKNNQKIKNFRNGEKNADEDKFSSASSTTVFNSYGESDVDNNTNCSKEDANILYLDTVVDAARKLKYWHAVEDNKQLSPVSVLEQTESDEVLSLHYKQYNLKTTKGESSTSMSQCKLKRPLHYGVQELQELVGSNSYSQYIINKRALQQTKQLLIDCVREVVESYRKRDKRKEHVNKILGAEELWKLVCENVWLWSQDSIDETNIIHLLHYDFLASAEEWSADFEQLKKEVCMEVGDAILEDVINEIVIS